MRVYARLTGTCWNCLSHPFKREKIIRSAQNKFAAKASYFDEIEVREYFNDVIISNKLQ